MIAKFMIVRLESFIDNTNFDGSRVGTIRYVGGSEGNGPSHSSTKSQYKLVVWDSHSHRLEARIEGRVEGGAPGQDYCYPTREELREDWT